MISGLFFGFAFGIGGHRLRRPGPPRRPDQHRLRLQRVRVSAADRPAHLVPPRHRGRQPPDAAPAAGGRRIPREPPDEAQDHRGEAGVRLPLAGDGHRLHDLRRRAGPGARAGPVAGRAPHGRGFPLRSRRRGLPAPSGKSGADRRRLVRRRRRIRGGFRRAGQSSGGATTRPPPRRRSPRAAGRTASWPTLPARSGPSWRWRHPLSETGRAIAGHSVGSLLVAPRPVPGPPVLHLALASAPSIWWDGRSILRLAADLRDRQAGLRGHLYLGAGGDDTPSMIGDLALLEKQLRDRPFRGLRVDSERFAGRDHYDVVPLTLRGGLAALFGRD